MGRVSSRIRTIGILGAALLAGVLVVWGPPPKAQTAGNTLRVVTPAPPDSLDPAISYMAVSWQMMFNTYDSLLTYRKESGTKGAELVPDLATSMPQVLDGGKTYRFTMVKGVKFAPPVNREVLPSDLKYSIERVLRMASPGSGFYMVLEGAEPVAAGKAQQISGIVIDDAARTIEFRLTRPDATFLYVLALQFSSAIPKGTPLRDMTTEGLVPGTGPYMFTEYVPLRRIRMVRNPNFRQWSENVPNGYVDGVTVQLGVDPENGVTLIKRGKADYLLGAIPRSKMPELLNDSEWKQHVSIVASTSTSYIFMDSRNPPFNNVKMRQAINWAIDRRAMVKLSGGTGVPSSTILPTNMPGYRDHKLYAGGPDMDRAKQLVAESGMTPGNIEIWCRTTAPQPDMAVYLQGVLTELGFTPSVKCVDPANYFTLVGNASTKAAIGFGNWGMDFPEGSNFIDVLLNGKRITPEHSNNLSWYSGADTEIERANRLTDQDARNQAWGDLDEQIMKDAAWAPYSHPLSYSLTGKRVTNLTHSPVYELLYMRIRLKGTASENGNAPGTARAATGGGA
jgi:peptide/nickel transport system substrate-binding protein